MDMRMNLLLIAEERRLLTHRRLESTRSEVETSGSGVEAGDRISHFQNAKWSASREGVNCGSGGDVSGADVESRLETTDCANRKHACPTNLTLLITTDISSLAVTA